MTRKTTSGPIRDKERTKMKLLTAVGVILKKEGFTGLNVSRVATKANLHRKLIYEYFGGMENLVKEYLNSRDYWSISLDQIDEIIEESKKDFGKKTALSLLENQFDSLMANEEMRKIINWGLSEDLKPLKELNKERERLGEELFTKITDDYFKDSEKNIRAIEGILIGGIYYLTLQAKMSGETMCGIDINTVEGQLEIKKTLKQIIEWAYS
ncbi:TetR family transcriptional regulator (plasmid) [Chryseobacterium glaciei]|uniref:TetR family transcriptional regulator n=1 Tax=Chryseobacterium glaciei TaxID=1685010 RepID=A0A172Y202_9FLAO|nr:TetR/AcrR family transcriptional regulator [Chryseobacterium glaciei]ANF53288.1 TetR family transcriptional regulator [Chryseobacterium glaciei]